MKGYNMNNFPPHMTIVNHENNNNNKQFYKTSFFLEKH